jgi:hypothetical protein
VEILEIPNQLLDMGRVRRTKLVVKKVFRDDAGDLTIDFLLTWGPYKWEKAYRIPAKEITKFTIEDFKEVMLRKAEDLKREEQNTERVMAGIKDFLEKPVYLD